MNADMDLHTEIPLIAFWVWRILKSRSPRLLLVVLGAIDDSGIDQRTLLHHEVSPTPRELDFAANYINLSLKPTLPPVDYSCQYAPLTSEGSNSAQ